MYWRQPPNRRTMQNYLELARAVSSRLNVLDARETRWSAEVTLRRRANEPDAPGMFVSLTAKDVADEVFHVTLDTNGGPGFDGSVAEETERGSARSVLVLRSEKRCVEGVTPVKEYLHRCKTHRLTHRSTIEGAQFWSGDFAVRVGKVENMQGTFLGAVLEIEYAPVCFAAAAEPALDEFAARVRDATRDVVAAGDSADGADGADGQVSKDASWESESAGALVAVPASTLATFGLEDRPFGDAAAATLCVACVVSMQS